MVIYALLMNIYLFVVATFSESNRKQIKTTYSSHFAFFKAKIRGSNNACPSLDLTLLTEFAKSRVNEIDIQNC